MAVVGVPRDPRVMHFHACAQEQTLCLMDSADGNIGIMALGSFIEWSCSCLLRSVISFPISKAYFLWLDSSVGIAVLCTGGDVNALSCVIFLC